MVCETLYKFSEFGWQAEIARFKSQPLREIFLQLWESFCAQARQNSPTISETTIKLFEDQWRIYNRETSINENISLRSVDNRRSSFERRITFVVRFVLVVRRSKEYRRCQRYLGYLNHPMVWSSVIKVRFKTIATLGEWRSRNTRSICPDITNMDYIPTIYFTTRTLWQERHYVDCQYKC